MTGFGTEHVILRKQLSAHYVIRTEFGQDSLATAQFTILIRTSKNSEIENQTIDKKAVRKTTVTNFDWVTIDECFLDKIS